MRLFVPFLSLSVIAMSAACMEQGSSPLTTTGPSQVTDAGTATPSARSAGPVATAASAMKATVDFGMPNVGSGFPRRRATISRRTPSTTWCLGP